MTLKLVYLIIKIKQDKMQRAARTLGLALLEIYGCRGREQFAEYVMENMVS